MSAITLELHVPNLETAADFYAKFGFVETWRDERPDSEYLVMALGTSPLCFMRWSKPHSYFGADNRERGVGVEVVVVVSNIHQAYQTAEHVGCVVNELRQRHWGASDFRIKDPFGYYIRFTEPVDVLAQDYGGRPPK